MLPMTVLRRLDCVLEPTKEKILEQKKKLEGGKLKNIDPILCRVTGMPFYNTSRYTFEKLKCEPDPELRDYENVPPKEDVEEYMKRDMDLVRKILLAIEDESSGYSPQQLKIEGYDEEQIGYHILIMIEAKLLEGQEVSDLSSPNPGSIATRMTWEGHDFLDACREEKRWQKAKGIAGQVGGITLEVFKKVLTEIMVDQAKGLIS